MLDFHTHNTKTAEGTSAIRSFSIIHPPSSNQLQSAFSIGLHPWHINEVSPNWDNSLKEFARHPNCIMIGECGLDALKPNLDKQQEIFITHIHLSEELAKPIIIHSVRTHHTILQLHNTFSPTQPWHIHGFTGSSQMAIDLLSHGIGLSFGTYLIKNTKQQETFKTAKQWTLQHNCQQLIHLETDESDISIVDLYEFVNNLTSNVTK